MTREHKLALIVSFTLVLVVGVLISDHFSKARTARVAAAETDNAAQRFGGTEGLKPVGLLQTGYTPLMQSGSGTQTPDSPLPPVNDPIAVQVVTDEPPSIVMGVPQSPQNRMDQIAREFEPAAGSPGRTPQPLSPDVIPVAPRGGASPETIPGLPPSTIIPPITPPRPEPVRIEPPREELHMGVPVRMFTRHDVREGESVYRIAKDRYGDGSLWTKLRDFNKGKISDSGSVREGVTLLLPPKEALLGKPLPVTPEAQAPAKQDPKPLAKPAKPDAKPAETAIAKTRTYTVQRGDVLSDVARKLLGTSKRWMEIHDLNKDILDDENSLQVGMVLKIPAK